ncbi:MAG: lysine--tRNA ligase [Candidatus Baltobacteraceae bacterium]
MSDVAPAGRGAEETAEVGRREAELIEARRSNLAALRALGRDPFLATRYEVTAHAIDVGKRFADLTAEAEPSDERVALAGRILALRKMGKNVFFADLHDRTGKLQLYVRKDAVGEATFGAFDTLDIGDVVGASGTVFRSKAGELTLRVLELEVLAKALLPLPDKWHGLVDVEKRYRQRYVDLIVNPEVRDVFIARSRIVSEVRRFIDARGFYEVETPTLLHVAGGAAARPFRTHSNALDVELDLRIATELSLKRLIVGGLERVYEIGRIFRNEGIDTTHNPEFTMLELYAAYWSVDEMMAFNEELLAHLVAFVARGDCLTVGEREISFARPFRRIAYLDALREWGGLARAELLEPAGAAAILKRLGLPESPTHAHALDKIFERLVEPHLDVPTFVHDYPLVLSPLAKRKAGDGEIVDRYELFAANFEVANAFTELNDPDDQRRRFEAQIAERARGDVEIPPPDWDFVRALEHGMPPTAGIGIGVDRLVMLLTNNPSIRDVILFPLQRTLE